MKVENINEPFYKIIQQDIDVTGKKVTRFKIAFYAIRILQIVLGALVSILAGLGENYKTGIVILGVSISGLTAVDALFQIDLKRSTFSIYEFELRQLRDEIIFKLMKKANKNDLDGIGKIDLNDENIKELYNKYITFKSNLRKLSTNNTDNSN